MLFVLVGSLPASEKVSLMQIAPEYLFSINVDMPVRYDCDYFMACSFRWLRSISVIVCHNRFTYHWLFV